MLPRLPVRSFFDRRRAIGSGFTLAGAATLGLTLALTAPATGIAASTGAVFLVISLSDSTGGQLPGGGTVTVTASLSNSSANSSIGDATPTVTVSYDQGTLSFLGNGSGWTCSGSAGQQVCTDGTIAAGGGTSLPVTFSVTTDALVGDNAFVTGTVTDGAAAVNSGSFSSQTVATDSATVANAAAYTKDVNSNAYTSKVGGDQVVGASSATSTFTFTDGGVTIHLVVPAGALGSGAHVSVYKANSTYWNSTLATGGQGFVDGYAAAWTEFDENTPNDASGTVTLEVIDPSATSTQTLYRATTTGRGTATGTVGSGTWDVAFTQDPGFVLVAPAAATTTTTTGSQSPATTSSNSSAGGTTISPPNAGAAATTPHGAATVPLAVGVLLFVGGVAVLGTRRRRQDG